MNKQESDNNQTWETDEKWENERRMIETSWKKQQKGWLIEIEMNKWIENNLANLMIEKNEKMIKDWLKERKIGKRKRRWLTRSMNDWMNKHWKRTTMRDNYKMNWNERKEEREKKSK